MKDEITIGLNGKTIASFGIDVFKGITPIGVKSVSGFKIDDGVCETGEHILEINVSCILEKNCPADYVDEKKGAPIELVVSSRGIEVITPNSNPVPASTYNEIPIKTRKQRGPNKPKEEAPEKSVFDKPAEETVAPVATPLVEEKKAVAPKVEEKKMPVAPTVTTPTTSARVNELAKLIKMWSKASGLGIDYVTVDRLKSEAFDIVENDSDETIVAGIGEAKRLMGA